jgi:hypothetical protein
MQWDTEPSTAAVIGAGEVLTYTLQGVTRYRLVPNPYDSTEDAFYAAFDGTNLTTKLIARNVI